ncbi:hypothetical protein J14TS2_07100 [Bacillus sp. J14TS2]|uniref:hypothetical protein n=1 Tax=Bacillus sp. J14TS2 TaxID=2807188 RepID=UPI001B2AC2CA|nr:hypothetical protein [Bacillus sp. J14TS2]GIN70235.1 hypothetical protein J14TS2_07100 [Bacillus sp. J14TS2]
MRKSNTGGIIIEKRLWIFFSIVLIYGCDNNELSNGISESFAYEKSIFFQGNVYVAQDIQVEKVDKKIGTIKYHSTKEEDSTDENFSNYYEVGTDIFKISNIDTTEAIAIEVSNGYYIKAINEENIK